MNKNHRVFGIILSIINHLLPSKQLVLGDAVNVAANSVLAESCPDGHVTFAGAPAKKVKDNPQPWYAGIWGGDTRWLDRVSRVEALRQQLLG